MTTNKKVLQFVDEAVALAKPDKVVWIDGSEAQLEALRKEAIASGEMIKLNDEKLPGCLYHRTKPNDVARVEGRTFICSRRKEDAGSSPVVSTNRYPSAPVTFRLARMGLFYNLSVPTSFSFY